MKLKIKNKSTIQIMYIIMITCICVAPNTIIGYTGVTLFMGCMVTVCWRLKLRFRPFLFLELLFFFYLIIQVVFFDLYSDSVQMSGIRTMLITFLFDVAIFNYISKEGVDRASEDYATGIITGTALLILLYGRSITEGGLMAFELIGFSIFKVGGVVSTNIAWVNIIAIVLLWQKFLKEKNRVTLCKIVLLFLFVLLTGRRKIFLFLISSMLLGTYLFSSNQSISKALKSIFAILLVIAFGFLILTQVPVMYNFIGKRLFVAINYILGISGVDDPSIRQRSSLLFMARNAWLNSPVWGQGYGSFSALYNNDDVYSHNNIFELLVSTGILGTLLYYSRYIYLTILLIKKSFIYSIIKWNYLYWLANLIAFVILEYYQVTYVYRSFTIFLVYIAVAVDRTYVESWVKYGKSKCSNVHL